VWRGGSHPLGRALHEAGLRIDDFRTPGGLFLLSHFHSDHTRGLEGGDPGAPVVASPETALLATRLLGAPEERFVALRGGETISLDAPARIRVTAIDANHCPGALMFLVESEWGRLLYTGDFRLDERMRGALRTLPAVDLLVADNTYDHPRYRFPSQEEAIDQVVAIAGRHVREREVAIAVYTIGKTRILRALRERLGLRTYVGPATARAYRVLGLDDLVTRDRQETPLRGYARGYFERYFKMRREYREGRTVAIIPTGWAVDVRRPEWNFHYVAYSEHCDFHEREEFVASLRPAAVENLLEPAGPSRGRSPLQSAPSAAPAVF
jgi:DNA cross-link repair 1B protein